MVRYGEVILLQKLVKQSCQLKEELLLVTVYALEVRIARVSWSDTVDCLNSRVINRDCVFGVSLDSPNSFNSLVNNGVHVFGRSLVFTLSNTNRTVAR